MKYFYNYSFLNKWMEANRKITNREIMNRFLRLFTNNVITLHPESIKSWAESPYI